MARDCHPLKAWLLTQSGTERPTVSAEDYARFAASLPSRPEGESIRQIACGYRRPSWDLAFEIEAATAGGVLARDLRDEALYAKAAS